MRIKILLLLILLSLNAAADEYTADSMKISVVTESSFNLTGQGKITAVSHLVPENDDRQSLGSVKTFPDAQINNNSAIFVWENPTKNHLEHRIESIVRTNYTLKRFHGRVIEKNGLENYLRETFFVDFNHPSIKKASGSIKDKDNQYEQAHEYAKWVKENIEYKTTKQTEGSKSASWTLGNGIGNCDELTYVFMALCRANDIPVRFVSGLAYSGILNNTRTWERHGWAEVYFPEKGWLPYDVTFGEFGYLDAAHVKLRVQPCVNESNVIYKWDSENISIESLGTKTKTNILSIGQKVDGLLTLDSGMLKEHACIGSYDAMEVTVNNSNDFYVPASIGLRMPDEVKSLEEEKYILLQPRSSRKLYFIVQTQDLQKGYTYSFQLRAKTNRGESTNSSFKSSGGMPCYTLDDIRAAIEKAKSSQILLNCTGIDYCLLSEKVKVNCTLFNKINISAQTPVCIEDKCIQKNIKPGQNYFQLSYRTKKPGEKRLKITAMNITDYVSVDVLEKPEIKIFNVTAPEAIEYDQDFEIGFFLVKENVVPVKNCHVNIKGGGVHHEWHPDFKREKRFQLKVDKNLLTSSENDFQIIAEYEDSLGRVHEKRHDFKINVENVSAWHRLIMLANTVMHELKTNLLKVILVIISSGVLTAIVMELFGKEK